jgi:glyoxylase-like metal-dependent hydrolase (beta-lactamase superfamily II)/8-oxo-dGTP pyrophosphatase MutT (NUDIX family)
MSPSSPQNPSQTSIQAATAQAASAPQAANHAPAKPASTLVVVRDAKPGIEVLLLRRAERGDHASGAWVFPGGVLDARDREWHAHCSGLDDRAASAQLGMPEGGLDYHVAAIRECFEEAGLLLARDAQGRLVTFDGERGEAMLAWRGPLHRGERTLGEFCETFCVTLAPDLLVYHTRWVTPTVRAKRWDTRFFFVEAPATQDSAHDEVELVEHLWLTPAEAIARSESLKLLTPTRTTLETMAGFDSVADLMAHLRTPRTEALQIPRVATGSRGMLPVAPTDHAWAEVGRLDPLGHGNASYEIIPGNPVRLSERVIRITAPNPGVMTGPGTNSYLVGDPEANVWAVIDPGPDDPGHIDRIVACAPGPIRWIFATHTHLDHSPGCARLKALTGAAVYGRPAPKGGHQDLDFAPDVVPDDGDRFVLSERATLAAVHTPGHASNHLCFLLEEERTLFTGDHLMQGSTVVINPPDGDMSAYLASLRSLLGVELAWLAPAHGFLIGRPREAIEGIIAHRLKREAKVLQALRAHGPGDGQALVAHAYDDTPVALHGWAQRSLAAHLHKLRDDGLARESEGVWSAVPG